MQHNKPTYCHWAALLALLMSCSERPCVSLELAAVRIGSLAYTPPSEPCPCMCAATQLTLDFASLLGPIFFSLLAQLMLPVMLITLVYEKQQGCAPLLTFRVSSRDWNMVDA